MKPLSRIDSQPWAVVWNIALMYVVFMLCRIAFLIDNLDLFDSSLDGPLLWNMFKGGLLFDSSAIGYTFSLYVALCFLPLHIKERAWWQIMLKCMYVTVGSVCAISCLIDSVYFPFSKHRTTMLAFSQFEGNTNLLRIFGIETVHHWPLTLLGIAIIAALILLYVPYRPIYKGRMVRYYATQTVALAIAMLLTVCGIRGGMTTAIRPLAVSNAHQYVNQPLQTGIVLNTPFAVLRTIGKTKEQIPHWFEQEELDSLYSPIHIPADSITPDKRNIVILIVESFAREFVGALNSQLDNGRYRGYTEFTDSLLPHCLAFERGFANSALSIDAIPSVTASIPRLRQPFQLTPYSLNKITGLAGELRDWGYSTAFFHGAENSSMGFQAIARHAGYQRYYGRTEYNADPHFNGDGDFDGTWAIWDEPFLQFFARHIGSDLHEPFCATLFTASSHHPFAMPEQYRYIYKDEGKHKLHKCIRYTDNAIRQFFNTARQQPWYKNTVFVIVADHASSKTTHAEYETTLGEFKVPILFYDPSGRIPAELRHDVAQQTDIMPTLLGIVGYNRPYIAFGRDLLNEPDSLGWSFNWDHVPQWIEGDYVVQYQSVPPYDVKAIYNYAQDPLLKHDIKGTRPDAERQMERRGRAFMQCLHERMKADAMTLTPNSQTE